MATDPTAEALALCDAIEPPGCDASRKEVRELCAHVRRLAADLLANDTFLSACEEWQRNGRANIIWSDWLEDLDLYGQALAWRWAASEPGRPGYAHNKSGFAPRDGSLWKWYFTDHRTTADDLPNIFAPARKEYHGFPETWHPTFSAAIAWFLDRFAECLARGELNDIMATGTSAVTPVPV